MKKTITYMTVLSSLALTASLAACGPGEEAQGNKEQSSNKEAKLIVWEDIEKGEGIKDIVSKFERDNDVDVKVIEKPYAKQIEDLRLDGPAGTGPDLLTMPGDQIGTAVTEGIIKEMDVPKGIQSIYTDVALDSQKVNGKLYGVPKAVETTVLYYNKKLVSEEKLPKTLEEWYALSKKTTTGQSFGFLALFDQIYYAQSVLSGYGGYIFKQDGQGNYQTKEVGLSNTGAIEGATYIQKFYKEKLFPSGIIGEQGINVLESLFTEGKAAAIISGPWNVEPFTKAGIDFGITKLPELENGKNMSSFIGVKSYNVSAYSKQSEMANKLALYLTNAENSKKRFEITKEVPAVSALAQDPTVTKSPAAQAVAEQSKFSELTPNVPAMNEVWKPVDAALQTIATGKAEPEAAMKQAVKTIDGQIEAKHGAK
ncbi:sugar ABC transporter substrate-binding protein [Exiguobacterium artemiae]|uniref:sugar ABC transporter substrate-binding protein n=1 Tax=Exiguobacterium artemiae TaxID=340145 RepID=UPI0029654A05|nr:extracellular solute-binding protein [Exiguobacterium sibiricum]MDW2886032.1 extracellular solute-binding protein [Exiguobacterium sibiricum]